MHVAKFQNNRRQHPEFRKTDVLSLLMPTNFIRIIAALVYVSSFFLNAPWNNLPATGKHFSSLSSFKYLIYSTDFFMYVSLGFKIAMVLYSLASQRHISRPTIYNL